MDTFFIVLTKLLVMTVMIFVGWLLSKKNKLSTKTVGELTWILLNVVTPALIINSFSQMEAGSITTKNMLLCLLLSVITIGLGVVISPFLFKKQEEPKKKVYRFAMTFSNSSFMGIPLIQAVVDSEGIVYASIFIAVFNFMLWTCGYRIMNSDQKLKLKNIFFNAGTIGFVIGLLIYVFQIPLPEIIASPIESLSLLNTPVAMLIFGFYIASIKLRELFTEKNVIITALLRLIAMPVLMLGFLVLFKPIPTMFLTVAIQGAAPAATTTVLFAASMNGDAKLASKVVIATNLLCLITIPFYVSFVQIIINTIL